MVVLGKIDGLVPTKYAVVPICYYGDRDTMEPVEDIFDPEYLTDDLEKALDTARRDYDYTDPCLDMEVREYEPDGKTYKVIIGYYYDAEKEQKLHDHIENAFKGTVLEGERLKIAEIYFAVKHYQKVTGWDLDKFPIKVINENKVEIGDGNFMEWGDIKLGHANSSFEMRRLEKEYQRSKK